MNVKKNLKIKSAIVLTLMLVLTFGLVFGVYAANQNVISAKDNVTFVADPYVDATVFDGETTFTFTSTSKSDDEQVGDLKDVTSLDWTDNGVTEDTEIDMYATIILTITNTSTIETNVLQYNITNNFACDYCTCEIENQTGALAIGESIDVVITFVADGLHDFEVNDVEWTITLVANK